MDSINQKYIKSLCAMHEDALTKNIIKPLFESMGNDRVEFNGGVYERGKDLIAQRENPPSNEMYVTYVQTKKIGDIQNTKESAKLSQLLHQLRQCCTGTLTDLEGKTINVDRVFLACPEQITNRLKEEIDSQLFGMPLKVYPYDGPKIISDIKKYKPDLLDLLSNIKDKLTSDFYLSTSNDELLAALKNNTQISLDKFYCDLSFFVGSADSNLLLHLDVEFSGDDLYVKEDDWGFVKSEIILLSKKHNLNMTVDSIDDIEISYNKMNKVFKSDANKENIYKYNELEEETNKLNVSIDKGIDALMMYLDKNNMPNNSVSDVELLRRKKIVDYLLNSHVNKDKDTYDDIDIKGDNNFYKEAKSILEWINDKKEQDVSLKEMKVDIVWEPLYKVRIDTCLLMEKIKFYKDDYFNNIDLINNEEIKFSKLKSFLSNTEKSLSLLEALKKNDSLFRDIVSFKYESVVDRVSISPHDIFSTGHDIAVYGGAGVGKTTTLHAYAKSISEAKDKLIFYVPLNKLVDEIKGFIAEDDSFSKKDLLIKMILLSRNIPPVNENIEDARKIISDDAVLILDGLDEVYNAIPDVVPAISHFKMTNKNTQLIISSRDCVSYLNDINFLGITLLPFTKDQLHLFIKGWLDDNEKANNLIKSIDERDLYEHLKTPLLATITCSLVQKGIKAPSTENEIYSERLMLLTGEYDIHKNINRQKQKGDLLRKCAVKIAFYMHKINVRSLYKEQMLESLVATLSEFYDEKLLSLCIDELINPCNVIHKDPVTSKYSFGHFRFQEHLASVELKTNRSVDLTDLVINDWWRGVLSLYAQDNEFSYLFEDVFKKYSSIKKAMLTFKSMVNSSPFSGRAGLKELLGHYEKSDFYDENIYIDSTFDEYELTDYL